MTLQEKIDKFSKDFTKLMLISDWVGMATLLLDVADSFQPSNTHWRGDGDEYPTDPQEGDLFLRTDLSPQPEVFLYANGGWRQMTTNGSS